MARFKVDPDSGTAYFCTCTIVGWLSIFQNPNYFKIITDSLQYCREHKGIRLNGYVIMPNHLHLILWPVMGVNLSNVLRDFKRHTARRIIELLIKDDHVSFLKFFERAAELLANEECEHKVWRAGFHPEEIHSQQWFDQKLRYIHENPVRKGLVDLPEHWRYSSARNYERGDHSVIEVDFIEWY